MTMFLFILCRKSVYWFGNRTAKGGKGTCNKKQSEKEKNSDSERELRSGLPCPLEDRRDLGQHLRKI
jgi:hypothetical protein